MSYLDSDDRPWGRWEEYLNEDGYRLKRIEVKPGQRLSLQKHRFRSEHWVIVRGTGELTLDNTQRPIAEGDVALIPTGSVHRVENTGGEPLIIIETQMGICDEDDIIRLEDDYGRV